jgi:hypothetical protein
MFFTVKMPILSKDVYEFERYWHFPICDDAKVPVHEDYEGIYIYGLTVEQMFERQECVIWPQGERVIAFFADYLERRHSFPQARWREATREIFVQPVSTGISWRIKDRPVIRLFGRSPRYLQVLA